ncbi:sugar phosphate isomerase/epimerase family protein [Mesorhizobium sp. NPDC059054]|uniref:sugar phosphate isomerase/epimerase family protein n=1 Tax=unclassified Mesorhizobium TaxID=325217 RepID=UPI003676D66A
MALNKDIAVNLWTVYGWEPDTLTIDERVFSRLARAGASGIEIGFDDERWTFDWALGMKQELEDALQRNGLRVSGIALRHFFTHNPASQSADVRGRALRAMRDGFRVAREFGVETVIVVPGSQERRVSYEATYDAAVQTLMQAARYAESDGVTITVENVPIGFLQSPREFRALLDDVGSPAVKACLDLGNALADKQPFPENWVLELGNRIGLVHAKDHGRGPGGGTRTCGDGDVPWSECLQTLQEVGYRGRLVVETPPNEGTNVAFEDGLSAAERSVRFLAEILERTPAIERTTQL